MKYTPGQKVFFRYGDGTGRKGTVKAVITTQTTVKTFTDYRIEWGANDGSSENILIAERNVFTTAEEALQ